MFITPFATDTTQLGVPAADKGRFAEAARAAEKGVSQPGRKMPPTRADLGGAGTRHE